MAEISFKDMFGDSFSSPSDNSQLKLIKDRMTEKMKYAKTLPTKELFTKELAKGFVSVYKFLGL